MKEVCYGTTYAIVLIKVRYPVEWSSFYGAVERRRADHGTSAPGHLVRRVGVAHRGWLSTLVLSHFLLLHPKQVSLMAAHSRAHQVFDQ